MPLDEAALEALAAKLEALGIEAVAIFFMNSYANPAARGEGRGDPARADAATPTSPVLPN